MWGDADEVIIVAHHHHDVILVATARQCMLAGYQVTPRIYIRS